MQKDKDAINIITIEIEKMKAEGIAFKKDGKFNLSEIQRRTSLSRKKIKRLLKNGLELKPHGNSHKKDNHLIAGKGEEKAIELLKQGITNSSVIYDKLKATGYSGGLTTVKNFIKANENLIPAKRLIIQKPQGKVNRYSTGPGEMYQMDWGFVNVVDSFGKVWKCACFAMVCHHCGFRFIEFFPNAKQESLFIGMLHAFMVMGVPKIILTDNMASISNHRDCNGNPIFNKEYDDFQNLLGIETRLCKVKHPWTKGAVERLVQFVKNNFIQGRTFINVNDLNTQALNWCMKENSHLQKGLGVIPAEIHKTEPLIGSPAKELIMPYLAPSRAITLDGFVYYEGRRYGVPFSYKQKKARIMRNLDDVYILDYDSYCVLEQYKADWSVKPHYSEFQFEPKMPEEYPTVEVKSVMQILPPDNDFASFDF